MKQWEIAGFNSAQMMVAPLPHQRRLDDHDDTAIGQRLIEFIRQHRAMFDPIATHHACLPQCSDRRDGLDPADCMNGNWTTSSVLIPDASCHGHRIEPEHLVGEEFRRTDAGPPRDLGIGIGIGIGIGSEKQQMLGEVTIESSASEQCQTAGAEINGGIGDSGDAERREFASHWCEVGCSDPDLLGEPRITPMQPTGWATALIALDTRVVARRCVDAGERRGGQHPGKSGAMLHPRRDITDERIETTTI